MSGVEYFDDSAAINPFMVGDGQIDASLAAKEHRTILAAFEEAGIQVIKVAAPNSCQDGVYTANWALVRGNKAVLARLPNARQAEEPYAAKVLRELGKEVIELPKELRFSGQGDALPCGNYLFCGSQYRSDVAAQTFAAQVLACLDSLKIDEDDNRVNPQGGAIALGHPLGMTGSRILLTAALQLQRTGKRYALATMCIGVGQGYAVVLERAD